MPLNSENLRRARQSLEALRAAGIEWVSRSSVPPPTPPTVPEAKMPRDPLAHEFNADETPAITPESRRQSLTTLAQTVSTCTRCVELCSTRTQTVFGVGAIDPPVCFVGEAPGADEDRQGLPFVGAAGQLLTRILNASGFQREEVYICNTLKCRPPGNRTPKPDETENCREYLERQIALVRPGYMVALGGTAAQNLLQTTIPIGKLRGKFHDFHGIPLMVTYHPAYLLPHRAPEKKKDVWEDMKMLLRRMGRSIPGE